MPYVLKVTGGYVWETDGKYLVTPVIKNATVFPSDAQHRGVRQQWIQILAAQGEDPCFVSTLKWRNQNGYFPKTESEAAIRETLDNQ